VLLFVSIFNRLTRSGAELWKTRGEPQTPNRHQADPTQPATTPVKRATLPRSTEETQQRLTLLL